MAISFVCTSPFCSPQESQAIIERTVSTFSKKLRADLDFKDFFRSLLVDLSLEEAKLAKKYKLESYEKKEPLFLTLPEEAVLAKEALLTKIFCCLYVVHPQETTLTVADESSFQISCRPLATLEHGFLQLLPETQPQGSLRPLFANINLTINRKLFALTSYFTYAVETFEWLNKENLKKKGLEHPLKYSPLFLIPVEAARLKALTEEIGVIYERALSWDSKKDSLESLKENMAFFYYLFSHHIKNGAGNACQVMWLERAGYHFLKIEVSLKEDTNFYLQALTTPIFLEFKNLYKETVVLRY